MLIVVHKAPNSVAKPEEGTIPNAETMNSSQAHSSKGYQVIVTGHSAEKESWHIHSLDENSHSSIVNLRGIDAHIFQYDHKQLNRAEKSLDDRMSNIAAIIR